jgi:hypothetical protein
MESDACNRPWSAGANEKNSLKEKLSEMAALAKIYLQTLQDFAYRDHL